MVLSNYSLRNERCIQTYSGRQLNLLAPDPTQIEIADIAHGLAYQCCFNGQARYFYSIAQHSLLVAQQVACYDPAVRWRPLPARERPLKELPL